MSVQDEEDDLLMIQIHNMYSIGFDGSSDDSQGVHVFIY